MKRFLFLIAGVIISALGVKGQKINPNFYSKDIIYEIISRYSNNYIKDTTIYIIQDSLFNGYDTIINKSKIIYLNDKNLKVFIKLSTKRKFNKNSRFYTIVLYNTAIHDNKIVYRFFLGKPTYGGYGVSDNGFLTIYYDCQKNKWLIEKPIDKTNN